ncbi:MAG: PAS domain S-box protein [Bacteroidota bacterium]
MPVYHRNQFVGTFAKVVNLTGILTDMASEYLMGETGEMLVAQLKGDTAEFMNTLRFNSDRSFDFKLKLGDNIALPIQDALKGKSGAMVSVDYRGQKVIAEWKYIETLNWGIVVKMDEDEVLAPAYAMRKRLFIFTIIILLITLVAAYIFAFTFSMPILKLKFALIKAGKGNLRLQLPDNLKDEIGDLYLAFNDMINNLRSITISRNALNEEVESRKKAESQVSLLTKAIENSPVVKIITDRHGKITYVNKKFEENTGYSREEVLEKNPKILSSGYHSPEFYKEMWTTLITKGYWRGLIRDKKKDGELSWQDAAMSAIRDENGEITHFVSSQINVTDRVQIEDELVEKTQVLEKSRKAAISLMQDANFQKAETQKALIELEASQKELSKLTVAMEQSPIKLIITNSEGKIEYVNPYFSITTAYTSEEVQGKDLSILKSNTHTKGFYKNLWNTIKSGSVWKGEIHNKKKSGELYWDSVTIAPVFSEGQISNFIAISEDITVRKNLEENATLNRLRLLRHQNALNNIVQGNVFINPVFREAIQSLTEQAAFGLDVKRASIWLFTDADKVKLSALDIYLKNEKKHISGIELKETDYPFYFETIKSQKVLVAHNATTDKRTKELVKDYILPLNINSLIDVGISLEGEVLGVVCLESVGEERQWSIEEENFARSISDFIALMISNNNRKKSQAALLKYTKLQQLLAGIASRFIHIPSQNLDNEIENSLRLLLDHLQIDIAVIVQLDQKIPPKYSIQHLCFTDTMLPYKNEFRKSFPQQLATNIAVSEENFSLISYDENGMNREEANENFLYKMGIRSGLRLPIKDNFREYSGNICFLSTNEKITLTQNEINLLASFCIILENAFLNKENEAQLILAKEKAEEATLSKSIFLANMSHEIRTPLNAVLGFSEILSRMIDHPTQIDYLKSIRSSGKTLLNLINDILDLSKIEAGKLVLQNDEVNLVAILSEVHSLFLPRAREKGLDFQLNIPDNIPKYVILDELRLKQVVLNLTSNALKFTDVGFVRLSLKINRVKEESVDFELMVKDSGIGVSEDFKKRIFEAFEQQDGQDTRKYGGTGLGLAISQRIIKMMGGSISLKSEINKGSQFVLHFKNVPIAKETFIDTVKDVRINPEQVVFSAPTVLIVDDIFENRKLIKGYLQPYAITLIEAENGLLALAEIKNTRPDLIFMDLRMPVMNGKEAVKKIKANAETADIPVVALTASAFIKEDEEIAGYGFDAYVRKPSSLQDIVEVMTRFLPHSMIEEPEINKEPFLFPEIKLAKSVYKDLKENILPLAKELKTIRPRKKVIFLANELISFGEKNEEQEIVRFGQELKMANINFNFERENELILKLPGLFTQK